jgi:DNA-binding CsgD family transcriptional regulator/tetratricopeptide (TPR) repeat protein
MIGRSEELGRLRDALAQAEGGGPTAVIVGGEAGIGKTRLISEFIATLGGDARVLQGACLPLTDGLQPLAPVLEMLRPLGELPGTPQDQSLVFAAVRELLARLAAEATVIVVLEDLHWADPSTRALLAYLVHTASGRLLLVGTLRSDEVSRRHPLRSLLAELDRAGVARIDLEALRPHETVEQIAGVLNNPVDAELAGRIHARCGGNPFLVEELLAAGPLFRESGAAALPERTRDILLQRVRRLPPAQVPLLQAIAVAGRRAGHGLLAEVLAITDDVLLDQIRPAVEEQILVAVEDGYAFRHALVAEALVAEMLPHERARLHRRYAEALTGHTTADRAAAAAEMAHHWCLAGDPERGLLSCVDAGLAAEDVFAQSEARRHFDRAIALWSEAPAFDLVELCRHGAEAAYLEGDTDHAITLMRRALGEVDASRAGLLYERLGRYLWVNGGSESESIGAYQKAVELVPAVPSPERARVLTGLAGALTYADRPNATEWCEQALDVAQAAGARGEEGRARQSLGYRRAMAGDVEGGLELCRQALSIAAELDQSEELYRAYAGLVGVLRMAGRTAEAVTTALEGVGVARRRGADRTYGNLLLGDAVEALILLGRWDEADALLPAAPDVAAHGTRLIATNLWLSAANLHTWRGRFDQAQLFLDACTEAYASRGHGHVRSMLHANLSELCLWQGRFAEAGQWIRTELDLLGPTEFTSLLSRLVLQGLRAEAGLSRPADLTRLAGLLHEMALRPDPPPDAAALIELSRAELARVRGEPDAELWATAIDHWIKLDMPWPLAYSRWRLAEMLLAGRPDPQQRRAGASSLAEAHEIAVRLGAEPLRREVAALARRSRLQSALAPPPTPALTLSPLTDREGDVLELLCAGATNRRIAQQLFISEKTVSIHVSRILAKLGATNRGEAASIAHRTGLVRPHL